MVSGIGMTVFLLALGAILVSNGEMDTADYIAFNMSATGVLAMFQQLSAARRQFLVALPSFTRYRALLQKQVEYPLDQPPSSNSNSLVLMGGTTHL